MWGFHPGSHCISAICTLCWIKTPQFPKDFQIELLAIHSPLLCQSLLVSFPPLSYMLKFRGCSRLRWGIEYSIWFEFRQAKSTVQMATRGKKYTHPNVPKMGQCAFENNMTHKTRRSQMLSQLAAFLIDMGPKLFILKGINLYSHWQDIGEHLSEPNSW